MPELLTVRTSQHVIVLEGDPAPFSASFHCQRPSEGLDVVTLRLAAAEPTEPSPLALRWRQGSQDVHFKWHPACLHARNLPPEWAGGFTSELTRHAPVVCLHSQDGRNRLTVAASDAANPLEFRVGVEEESADLLWRVGLFTHGHALIREYTLTLRLDVRDLPYYAAIGDVEAWWRQLPGHAPRAVPEPARLPMYSTWYSFHQNLNPDAVVAQCRLAREMGCGAVIVDDGWQTNDGRRGYACTGDWQPERIPDLRGLVDRVHDLDMKFLLWYAVPFVGRHSRAIKQFEDKLLTWFDRFSAGVLDPRYPAVRAHLIDLFERALTEWSLDGFKLDFVDEFALRGTPVPDYREGMDYVSVPDAADRLLADVFDSLHRLRPDIMVEFRQEYIGPLMRRFGNMLRAGDCPSDALTNRLRTIDIRLLCGDTPCHSDMLMWHPRDSVENAALQMLSVLFAVPQVSVLLDRLPAEHLAMLRFWLAFWRENRDVLLDGELQPLHPETFYPAVIATTPQKRIVAAYQDLVIQPGPAVPRELLAVNGTAGRRLVLELAHDAGHRRVRTFDCQGRLVADRPLHLTAGLHILPVPPSGLVRLETE